MKFKELKAKTDAEIRNLLEELQQEYQDMSVKMRLNQLKNTHKIGAIKKDIARILTYLKQKA